MEKSNQKGWRLGLLIGCLLLTLLYLTNSTSAFLTQSDATVDVSITEQGFDPELTTISEGTTVRWTNNLPLALSLNSNWVYKRYFPIAISPAGSSKSSLQTNDLVEQEPLTAENDNPWFSTLELEPGESFSYTFRQAGEYEVHADSNAFLSSRVLVTQLDPNLPAATPIVTPTVEASPTKIIIPTLPTFTPTPTNTGPTSTPIIQLPTKTNTPEPEESVTPEATETETVVPTNTPSPTATIDSVNLHVLLTTDPADGTNIRFELNNDILFELDSDEVGTNDNDEVLNQKSFTDLEAGSHVLELASPSNFTLDTLSCTSSLEDETITIVDGTAQFELRANERIDCHYHLLKDSDFDRLADVYETDTRTFVSFQDTGTDPFNRDTDADGILDGDELLGTVNGLDLPGMGTNPLRKTVLVEYDWVEDSKINKGFCGNGAGGFHSHRPTAAMMNSAAAVYAAAPVSNPDGSTGIDLIQDYGQGGLFTGGNLLFRNATGLVDSAVAGTAFNSLKAANFDSNREGYFHYAVMAHQYLSSNNFSSGQAEIGGDDIIISIYNYNCSDALGSYAAVHELGHNMGLRHGGHDDVNDKPNYNSVMNYKFQFTGIDSNESCDGVGDGINSYSTGWRPTLNELDLEESEGVCGQSSSAPIDWNNNGNSSDEDVVQDINSDGSFTELEDHDDWGSLYFYGPLNGSEIKGPLSVLRRPTEIVVEPPIPDSVWDN